jgi:DNA-binding transcriptional LysR family regulator
VAANAFEDRPGELDWRSSRTMKTRFGRWSVIRRQRETCRELLAMHPHAARRDTREGAILALLPKERPIRLAQISGWPLHALDPDSCIRRQLEREYRAAGSDEPPFLLEGGDFHIAKAFAQAGLGVAILPEPLLSLTRSDTLVSRPLGTKFNLHTRLVYRDAHQRPPGSGPQLLRTVFRAV